MLKNFLGHHVQLFLPLYNQRFCIISTHCMLQNCNKIIPPLHPCSCKSQLTIITLSVSYVFIVSLCVNLVQKLDHTQLYNWVIWTGSWFIHWTFLEMPCSLLTLAALQIQFFQCSTKKRCYQNVRLVTVSNAK